MKLMYCTHCGHKINENADVCIYCGHFIVSRINPKTKEKPILKTTSTSKISKYGPIGFVFSLISVIFFLLALFTIGAFGVDRFSLLLYACPLLLSLFSVRISYRKQNNFCPFQLIGCLIGSAVFFFSVIAVILILFYYFI